MSAGRYARRYRWIAAATLSLSACSGPMSAPTDRVTVTAKGGLLAQGLGADGCHRETVADASGPVDLRNFTGASAGCPAEVAIFGVDRSAELISPTWTAASDHIETVAGALTPVSVIAYVAALPYATQAETDAACRRAEADIARAHQLYNGMRCGMGVTARIQVVDLSKNWNVLYSGCTLADTLKAEAGHSPGALNAYYIVGSNGDKGVWCGPDVLIVSTISDNETFAHEVGHGLSLDHFPLPTANIMVSGSSVRDTFTLGQCFRCNFNPTSAMRRSTTIGPADCPQRLGDGRCPEVWWPEPGPPPTAAPPAGVTAGEAVRGWLECEECTPADLAPVVALGDTAVPLLRQSLSNLHDPVRNHLQSTYRSLRAYCVARPAVPLTITEEAYVASYLNNARARYQLRAAVAAAQIRTAAALTLVREIRTSARRDVRDYLGFLLQ